jgi:endoglucanase
VSGGWYDAGDHGKYVVNAGISVWTLLNEYERLHMHGSSLDDFGDGKLNIPESGNKVNDLLDEARWEIEWMLKMQVPADKDEKLAGLVHHKMHDQEWTALGMVPPTETEIPRFLRPVSTAATLNLAAAAAQAARVFKKVAPEFSKRCQKAAETAYEAAKQNPKLIAKGEDTVGGGPYNDDHVEDEFYWAAAELFATTQKPEYKKDLGASPFFKKMSTEDGGLPTAMTWGMTDALGTITLATVKGALPKPEQKAMQDQVIAAADKYLALLEKQGYHVPFHSKDNKYPWGSNSFIINNALVLGLAYDFTKDPKYVQGALSAANYLFGTNALAQSYVSGHGTKPLENPHHRFWSKQANPKFPPAPPGALSGGPNSSLQDPYAKTAGLPGCKPQKCFVDHIEAWSTNEITINWNAPLAWVMAFLDEVGPTLKGEAAALEKKPAQQK